MNEPVNEQDAADFHVGGRDREMPPEAQLEQLVSYIEATYDPTSPQYLAQLPDRITHAAMVMLGTAVDHAMPATAFADGVLVSTVELGELFTPSAPTGAWSISLYDGPLTAHNQSWRADAAAAAELSGVTVLDLDDPSLAEDAVRYALEEGASGVVVWAFGSAARFVPVGAEAYVLTYPTEIPAAVAAMPTFIQVATRDEVAPDLAAALAGGEAGGKAGGVPAGARVETYHSTHYIATPTEIRRRVQDVARFMGAC